ncbi:unnamed protein product [Linum tenue]|uniref:Disease resistance protein RGA3 n=1 Tax=Linum tenue TaxID=586396 RepID=A0AAV0PJ60_9ROSI|nr:unnamed protein product [Linum tenue]
MAFVVAEAILKKLGPLAVEQVGLLWGLGREVLKLKSTVTSIQAVLLDAEEQSGLNNQVQVWLQELKQVLYDADDLLDDFNTEALLRQQQMDGSGNANVQLLFSSSNHLFNGLLMAHRIKAIRTKLDEIDENRKMFNLQTRLEEPFALNKSRQTDSFVPSAFVGRDKDSAKIISLLLSTNGQQKVEVIPILGIGGLGKTALSQQIYNDERVSSYFQLKSWICVPDNFDETLVVKRILESLTEDKVGDLQLQTLKSKLKNKMDNKKFLFVLDDVWDNGDYESNWDSLMSFLWNVGAVGSKIIITTRIRSVANLMATKGVEPHELQGLSKQDSWTLFKHVTFKGEAMEGGERFVRAGEAIVGRCVGVPLAIRAMAGILSSKRNVVDWEALRDKQARLDRVDTDKRILATLRLSYDNLPSHLKPCFAYCSLFPKDCVIDVKMLVQLWMGQGYINRGQLPSSHLYEVGVEYFKGMLSKSFFQESHEDQRGNVKNCKMHDLMHDLALEVAGEENITLKASNPMVDDDVDLDRLRHMSVDFGGVRRKSWPVPDSLPQATKLRTFLPANLDWEGMNVREGKGYEMFFSNMTSLRALSLYGGQMKVIPPSIHKLKRLRYLNLSRNGMETLPDEIIKLVNLQVLILDLCYELQELPQDMAKLSNLEFLSLLGCWRLRGLPLGIGKLTRLKELSTFVLGTEAKISELKDLDNLGGALSIKNLGLVKGRAEAKAASLNRKPNLEALELEWNMLDSDNAAAGEEMTLEALEPHENLKKLKLQHYSGSSLPSWVSNSLKNVVIISLSRCGGLLYLPSLAPLVSLEELELYSLEGLEYIQIEEATSPSSSSSSSSSASNNNPQLLPRLKSLAIRHCNNLISWWSTSKIEVPLFPCLSALDIVDCPKLAWTPRFSVHMGKVKLSDVRSDLLGEFAASLPPPHSPTHSRFKELTIDGMEGLQVLPQELHPQLVSLESLCIQSCLDLTTLSPPASSEQHLAFSLYYCLPALRCLQMWGLMGLDCLPQWLQHSSHLRELRISYCHGLGCLPDWLPKLTMIETLQIKDCELLLPRLESRTAQDWHKVEHILNITINDKMVQRNGNYLELAGNDQHQEQEAEREEEEEDDHEVLPATSAQSSRYVLLLNYGKAAFL